MKVTFRKGWVGRLSGKVRGFSEGETADLTEDEVAWIEAHGKGTVTSGMLSTKTGPVRKSKTKTQRTTVKRKSKPS